MFKRIQRYCTVLVATLAGAAVPAFADDTELFQYATSSANSAPNVLIILDTSSNWGAQVSGTGVSYYQSEVAALKALATYFAAVGPSGTSRGNLNVALLAGISGNTDGAYVRFGLRNMMSADNRNAWTTVVGKMDNTEKSNNPVPALSMYEAYNYLIGGAATIAADSTTCGQRDYPGNTNIRSAWYSYFSSMSPAPLTADFPYGGAGSTVYQKPASVYASCAKNYIIYVSNGKTSGNSNDTSKGCTLLRQAGGSQATKQITITPNSLQGNCIDEWARYLNKVDFGTAANSVGVQNVVTYTIDIDPATDTTSKSMSALLKSAANNGGGQYYKITDASNATQLLAALQNIFNQVQAVNSVFASVSLPVSVNQRSTNLNQVYIGVFRPGEMTVPRWPGNLKEYQLGYDPATLTMFLADATGANSVDPSTDFTRVGAQSFWTYPSTYWAFAPDPGTVADNDSPDGPLVERGGAAQRLRMLADGMGPKIASSRTIYTYTGTGSNVALAGCGSNCAFSSTNGAISLGGVAATDMAAAIDWVRGANNNSASNPLDPEYGVASMFNGTEVILDDFPAPGDVRPSVHGDVLHSRPVVIAYNRGGTLTAPDENDVVVFYGGNDGMLHAVQGGKTQPIVGAAPGTELWSFVAEEFYSKLNRLRTNTPPISPPGAPGPVTLAGITISAGSNILEGVAAADIGRLRSHMTVTGMASVPAGAYVIAFPSCPSNTTLTCVALSEAATAAGSGTVTFTSQERPYTFDGSVTGWTKDANGDGRITTGTGDKAYIFVSMRRGGRMIYAFDVTDPTSPMLLWRRGCRSASGTASCDAGWEEIGQTWSSPNAASINASLGASNPWNVALIFGAGYDPYVEDYDPVAGTRSMGRGIYVVDALTGNLVRAFVASGSPSAGATNVATVTGMDYAIPSDVSIITKTSYSTTPVPAYRAYVGDTGGNIWRLDLASAIPGDWVVTKLASLAGTGAADKRKFLYGPDVVLGDSASADSTGVFDFVVIGSGDREHPFNGLAGSLNPNYPNAVTITNRFYMIKDRDTGAYYDRAAPPTRGGIVESNLFDVTPYLSVASSTTALSGVASAQGWFVTMQGLNKSGAQNPGEKVVGSATTVSGTIYFPTNRPTQPSSGVCGVNLGEAKQWTLSLASGSPGTSFGVTSAFTILAGGGFPPSPVPVAVVIDGRRLEGVISGTRVTTSASGVGSRVRSFIRMIQDKRQP